jgi:hypothetical protein
MIGAVYPILAPFTGSAQSLSRSLSPVDRLRAESSPATRRHQLFSLWKPLIHLPTDQFSRRIRHRELQKAIQYPETRSGSVQ